MIKSSDTITAHALSTTHGASQVLVTNDSNVAFVHGDDQLDEATLVIRTRCVINADAFRVDTCDCARRSAEALDVVRRAPLGVFVYLNAATIDSFADVLVVLDAFPNVRRLFLPFAGTGDVALLADTSDYELLHLPNLVPPVGDDAWPRPRDEPHWFTQLRDRFGRTIKERFNL